MSDLPKGWTKVALGDVCEIVSGGTPSRKNPEYFGGGVPWVKIGDMLQRDIQRTEEMISTAGLANSSARLLPKGTLLLSIFATIGRVATLGCEAATNQAIAGIVLPEDSPILTSFLGRYLESVAIHLASQGRGAAQANINLSILRSLEIPFPPLDEQRRIAAILDKADELRTKRRAALAKLDTLTQAIFIDMFGERLADSQSDRWMVLNDLIDPDLPICYGILKPGPNLSSGVPYVRVVDLKDGAVDTAGVRRTSAEIDHQFRRSRLRTGDLVMSIRGHVGRLARVPQELDSANITQDSARISVAQAEPEFVMEYLRHPMAQQWMHRNTKGVAVRGINIGDVRRIPVPLVPQHDQQRFVDVANRTSLSRVSARVALADCNSLFDSLQSRAFCGEL
ncbi:MAG: restriction endonuclease subunit S [Microthrixaceae bacterium]|nr:restriction endonuclease subunit S [Microthrixaceae bacterium]